ncbi:MAG: MoaD/ThiS family protein [Peptococcaceae bacterium]|nr:MoaD/ThiS family protein [Peptococcaceae bacterium]
MVTVRYFGPTRLLTGRSGVQVEAGSVKELLEKLSSLEQDVSLKTLQNSLIFVNGTSIQKLQGFKTKLQDGDEVQLFSPMGGG